MQQDSTERLMMLIEIINKGSVSYGGSINNSSDFSLPEILLSFILEKCIVCDVCGLRYPWFARV